MRAPPSAQRGFTKGPEEGAWIPIVAIAIVVALVHDGSWWQKAGMGVLAVLGLILFGLVVAGVWSGISWILDYRDSRRAAARLRRLVHLEREDPPAAAALANEIGSRFDSGCTEALRRVAALGREIAARARSEGPLRARYVEILTNHAPWSAETEQALTEGAALVRNDDLWSWLRWFARSLPAGAPGVPDRMLKALETYLARVEPDARRRAWSDLVSLAATPLALPSGPDFPSRIVAALERYLQRVEAAERRRALADCLRLVRDHAAWRRVAEACRDDLAALERDAGATLAARERQALDWLLGKDGATLSKE